MRLPSPAQMDALSQVEAEGYTAYLDRLDGVRRPTVDACERAGWLRVQEVGCRVLLEITDEGHAVRLVYLGA